MRNLKQSTHTTPSGQAYTIETFEIAGGRLVCSRVRHDGRSFPLTETWGMGNHYAAAAAARRLADTIEALQVAR
jgi:hypothetical protein